MNYQELIDIINSDKLNHTIRSIVGNDDIDAEKKRYTTLLNDAYKCFGDGDYHLISSPGRSEIGGNHTDHQHGNVVCAALSIDNVCACKATNNNKIVFKDANFGEVNIDISDLSIHQDEFDTSAALIRGITFRLKEMGYTIGGFEAICDSHVLIGASISSSACFEMMIVEIFNCLFNDNKVNIVQRALIGQYAENVYFGKPSGLLDQLAISAGGFTTIDFKDPNNPIINSYDFSFNDYGYKFLIVNTKGDHSNLSYEYAAIPNEIKLVAHELGVEYLADSSYEELISNLKTIREKVNNDRAILRSIHFFNENRNAILEKQAIEERDIDSLLNLMKDSGRTSFMYLQNVYPASRPTSQSIAIALAITENYLNGRGAFRIQGGGFEGTIISVVPNDMVDGYRKLISSVYGEDAILEVSIRPFGTKTII